MQPGDQSDTLERPLRVVVRPGREAVVIALHGELDLFTKQLLTGQLDEVVAQTLPHPPGLIIDLSQLTFCDSSGLSVLIAARQLLEAAGRPLALPERAAG